MANTSAPKSARYNGWYKDDLNSRLEFYFRGTKIGHLDASGFSITNDSTARMTNGVLQNAGIATGLKTFAVKLGSSAAIASDGAAAILPDCLFVAPAALKIVSAWRTPQTASEVTKGTATTSASYRRMTLICNTAASGSGTDIIASINATASVASLKPRAFTTVASTVPAGGIVLVSHSTVGAATADGTDMAASIITIAYELV